MLVYLHLNTVLIETMMCQYPFNNIKYNGYDKQNKQIRN